MPILVKGVSDVPFKKLCLNTSSVMQVPLCFWGNWVLLGLAENPARGIGFWSQNIEGAARGVLKEKPSPEGEVISQPQHPTIRSLYSKAFKPNSVKIIRPILLKTMALDLRFCCSWQVTAPQFRYINTDPMIQFQLTCHQI